MQRLLKKNTQWIDPYYNQAYKCATDWLYNYRRLYCCCSYCC